MSTAGTIAAAFVVSSGDFKENIVEPDMENLIGQLNKIDIKKFNYKEEMNVPGTFFGPIVEETPSEFTEGKAVNLYNLVGALIATVQEQNKRISELESK